MEKKPLLLMIINNKKAKKARKSTKNLENRSIDYNFKGRRFTRLESLEMHLRANKLFI